MKGAILGALRPFVYLDPCWGALFKESTTHQNAEPKLVKTCPVHSGEASALESRTRLSEKEKLMPTKPTQVLFVMYLAH